MVSPTVYTYAYPFTLNATEPTDIHTLSLHDALPIWHRGAEPHRRARPRARRDPARLSGPLPHRAALPRAPRVVPLRARARSRPAHGFHGRRSRLAPPAPRAALRRGRALLPAPRARGETRPP